MGHKDKEHKKNSECGASSSPCGATMMPCRFISMGVGLFMIAMIFYLLGKVSQSFL